MSENNYDIFISYKRKSLPTANNLYYRLTTRGYSTFFDLEEMGRDNFNTQLLKYIENAKDVLVILEEGSLDACKSDDWEKDWFCHEIAIALEKKKNIIPILLGGYQMPPEDFFPDKLKEFHFKESPDFSFSYFEAYLDKLVEKGFLNSTPNIQDKATSVFKFYSNEDCQVFKEGKLVCSLEGMSDEPYYLPVPRKGDYRFKGVNAVTTETKIIKEHIAENEEKEIEIEWIERKSTKQSPKLPNETDKHSIDSVNNNKSQGKSIIRIIDNNQDIDFNVHGISFKMILVHGGAFNMGAQNNAPNDARYDVDAEKNESPVHKVVLNDYYIGETVVTQALWESIMGTNPSYSQGDNFPVEQVSRSECLAFIEKLNTLTNRTFRLPTEAEWEFAARGGLKSCDYKYSGSDSIGDIAWYRDNYRDMAHPVKKKFHNELGLYDMSGGVWEWCEDVYGNYNYSMQDHPIGRTTSEDFVLRGGSRIDSDINCRVTKREFSPDLPNRYIGFRLALNKKEEIENKIIKVDDVEFKMIYIQGSEFLMGAQNDNPESSNFNEDAYNDESPVHSVILNDFFIGETVVTQALWKTVMKDAPTKGGGWSDEFGIGNDYPAYWMSREDCLSFIQKLNEKTGYIFRMPTEAEWEFAARGGTKSCGYKYSGSNSIGDVAWFSDNSERRSHPVKQKQPNELGLYDMSGNVWETCEDWFNKNYYSESPLLNPLCEHKMLSRVMRGGGWNDFSRGCRVAVRGDATEGRSYRDHGLRLVMSPIV